MVTLSDIKPEDIPDIPTNKFLMRGAPNKENDGKHSKRKGMDLKPNRVSFCQVFH